MAFYGFEFNKMKPMTGWRRKFQTFLKVFYGKSIALSSGLSIVDKHLTDYDYSYYLGSEYKGKQRLPVQTPTLISNHVSQYDNVAICARYSPDFVADSATLKMPIIGKLNIFAGCLFVSIEGEKSNDERNKIMDVIRERQVLAEKTKEVNQVAIFPEGSTSNGNYLLPLKRGAFDSFKPIKPIVLKYSDYWISP